MERIAARCDPTHREYLGDPNVIRRWQNGVRYEVAMVLRYLRDDSPSLHRTCTSVMTSTRRITGMAGACVQRFKFGGANSVSEPLGRGKENLL